MTNKAARECVDELCRRSRWNIIPWLRQVAPVVSGGDESPSPAASVKSSLSSYRTKSRVFTLNTSIHSIDYTRIVDGIGEDFSGERRCFIEVQISNI